jgi:GGDEF domain-containing protein
MAVYAAGAWDYCSQPLDVEVLLLKLETFVDARRSFGELHERSLLDVTTDMYSMRGMRRWSRELLARAVRGHQALACVALAAAEPALVNDGDRGHRGRDWRRTADLVASHRRASDVVGHLGNGTFAILAPETDADGASRLIGRLQRAARQASLSPQGINKEMQLDVGYWAIADLAAVDAAGADPVGQAAEALLHLRRAPNPSAVVSFDEITR